VCVCEMLTLSLCLFFVVFFFLYWSSNRQHMVYDMFQIYVFFSFFFFSLFSGKSLIKPLDILRRTLRSIWLGDHFWSKQDKKREALEARHLK
jgi:hypothetical protein